MNQEKFKEIMKEKTQKLIEDLVDPKIIHKIMDELIQYFIVKIVKPDNKVMKREINRKLKEIMEAHNEQI